MLATLFKQAAFLFAAFVCTEAAIKRWKPDTNFDNPLNWNLGRLPCPNDAIVFPTTAPEVFLSQDFTLTNVVLPLNGALLIATDLTLVFNDNATIPDPPEGCPTGETIRFNHTLADAWLNPSSWCIPLHDFDEDCLTDPQLDAEYVPCSYDDVLFGRDTSFYANVDLVQTMSVRSLMIDNTYQTTDSLQDYIETNEGKRRFTGAGLRPLMINILGLGEVCDDPSGCYCGTTDAGHINSAICAYRKCEPVPCPYAFTPVGHCCPICGSKMEFTYFEGNDTAGGFDIARFRNLLTDEYIEKKDLNYGLVHMILSKLVNGRVQLVLIDSDGGKQAAPMGSALLARIQSDASFKQTAAVFEIFNFARAGAMDSTTVATVTPVPTLPKTSGGVDVPWDQPNGPGLTGGEQAGLVVGVVGGAVALILVAALVIVFYRTRRYKGTMAPLDNLAVSINFDDLNEPVTTLRGMTNPMYGASSSVASAASTSARDYVVSVNFTDRETPSAIIEKASRDKRKRSSKQSSTSLGLENPTYNPYAVEQQQAETSITTPGIDATAHPSAGATSAAAAGSKKKSAVGLANPLFGSEETTPGAAPQTIGAASLQGENRK